MVDANSEFGEHPDAEQLRRFGFGLLTPEEAAVIEEHLCWCDDCAGVLEAMPNDSFVARLREAKEGVAAETEGYSSPPADENLDCLANHPRFEIIQVVGRGGMGLVVRCRDRALERDLALKVLLEQYRDQSALVSRFMEEARITGQLQHPYIVPVHELGTLADGRPYFAMKLVQGRTLAELLQERLTPAQDLSRFLFIFEQVCQTVAYAHSKGVIHRDLKPANVMVGAFGEVQVMDWGLAKELKEPAGEPAPVAIRDDGADEGGKDQTQAGLILGTFAYMPPEQASGDQTRVRRRSDVFGLGAMLCEILTGTPPYTGGATEVRAKARSGRIDEALAKIDGCGADAELIRLAKDCLAVDANQRPAEGSAVADAMAHYFGAVQERMRAAEIARARAETEAIEEHKRLVLAEAKAHAEAKRGKAEGRRRRATVLLGISLLMLLTGGAGFGWWYEGQQAVREAELATRRAITERDVIAALAEVHLRREEGTKEADNPERWKLTLARANDALKQAENALGLGDASEELAGQVAAARTLLEQDRRDQQLFATLERLWLETLLISRDDTRAPRDAATWLKAFKDYGFDLEAAEPGELGELGELATRIRQHPHRDRLVDEIGFIAQLQASFGGKRPRRTQQYNFRGASLIIPDWSKAARLQQILDAVDGDPQSFGTRWRAARAGRDAAALVKLAQSVEPQKLTPRGAAVMANDLLQPKEFTASLNLLRAVQERHPNHFMLNQVLGMTAAGAAVSEDGSLNDALRYLSMALASRGDNAATRVLMSQVYKHQGRKDEAYRAARAAVNADKTSAAAHHNLGLLFYHDGDWDRALEEFHEAARLDPVSALPHASLGQAYAAKKDHEQAIHHYKLALAREKAFAAVHLNLGNSLAAQNNNAAAIESYRQALELFPDYAMAHYNLGLSLAQTNEIEQAIRSFRDARDCDPRYVPAHLSLGRALLIYRRDAEGAIKCFQDARDLHPQVAAGHFQLADLLQGLGRHAQAEASLRKTVQLDPTYREAQARLGIALAAQNKWQDAAAAYRKALDQGEKDKRKKAALHDYLGIALGASGQTEEGIKHHLQALQLEPTNAMFFHNLGVAQTAHGDMEDAARSFAKAIEHDKNTPLFHLRHAAVLIELRDLAGAKVSATKALELAPEMGDVYHLLAQIHLDEGNAQAAQKALRQGQKRLPFYDPAQEVLRLDMRAVEAFLKGDKELPAVLSGETKVTDPSEKATLAMVCALKHRRYADAQRLFAEAFAAQPILANNVLGGARFQAACCAARAAGDDAAPVDASEQKRLRARALDWLTRDLETWRKFLQFAPKTEHGKARFRVRRWLDDPALAPLREAEHLKKLTPAERQAWTSLWTSAKDFAAAREPATINGPDLARLRSLVEFPSVSLVFDIGYKSRERDGRGNRIEPAKKIKELTARLNGSIDDADTYLDIAAYHGDLKEKDQANNAARQAEELLRPFLQTKDPREARRLLSYVRAHAVLNPTQWDKERGWIVRATELDPDDWRAWQMRGNDCILQAHAAVLGGRLAKPERPNEAVELLLTGKASPQALKSVEKLLQQARAYYERAKQLAPTEEVQWDCRIAFLFQQLDWTNALLVARGKNPLRPASGEIAPELLERGFQRGRFSLEALPELVGEMREAAERCPDHAGMQVFAFMILLTRLKERAQDPGFAKDGKPLLNSQDADFVRATHVRLEKIRRQASPETAPFFDSLLGYLHFQLAILDPTGASLSKPEPYFQRLVAAEPKNTDAADVLEFLLSEQGKSEAALEVARNRLAQAPSARNRYLLARCLLVSGDADGAIRELDVAVKADPSDPYALTAKAALLLRDAEKPGVWAQAGKFLDQARANLKAGAREKLLEDIDFITAIYHALSDRPVLARFSLETLRSNHPKNSRYEDAWKALGQ